jgi:hypothetical protein
MATKTKIAELNKQILARNAAAAAAAAAPAGEGRGVGEGMGGGGERERMTIFTPAIGAARCPCTSARCSSPPPMGFPSRQWAFRGGRGRGCCWSARQRTPPPPAGRRHRPLHGCAERPPRGRAAPAQEGRARRRGEAGPGAESERGRAGWISWRPSGGGAVAGGEGSEARDSESGSRAGRGAGERWGDWRVLEGSGAGVCWGAAGGGKPNIFPFPTFFSPTLVFRV